MKAQTGLFKVLLAGGALALAQAASAGNISFSPTPALTSVGGTVDVDLVWTASGPGDFIGAIDVDILFLGTVVAVNSLDVDPNNQLDSLGPADCGSAPIGIDGYNVCGLSFDSVDDLSANQGSPFALATFRFAGLAEGVTNLLFGDIEVYGDVFGDPISPTLTPGRICVSAAGTPLGCPQVPEPGTLALLGLGLAGLGLARRRNAS